MIMTIQRLILIWGLALLAGIGAAHAAEPPDHRHSVAVVIGNKTYKSRIPEVAYSHRDAEAMKAYLTQVLGYREANIIDLRDATQAEMTSAFGNERSHEGEIWSFLRPGKSHVTVFYSGHGVPGQRDKRGYLLPVDANPDTPEINGYPVDVLYEDLSKLEAASVTVYLDACFSGESDQGMLIRSASPVFVQASLPEAAGGLTVLTAARADQIASWDEENQHGLFTWHLLQALQGAADKKPFGNGDGGVTVAETRAYLDEEMSYAARRRFRRKQTASVQGTGETLLGVVPTEPVEVAALAPSFAVKEMDRIMIVGETRVNTRSGPGTTFDKIEVLSHGTEIEVTGKVAAKNWFRVELAGGRTAYVFAPLLRDISSPKAKSASKPPELLTPPPAPPRPKTASKPPELLTPPPAPPKPEASGTFVGIDLSGLQAKSAQLHSRVKGLQGRFLQLARRSEEDKLRYHSVVAGIESRLKQGSTPNNPILFAQWNEAQAVLEQFASSLRVMSNLSNDAADDAEFGQILINSVQAYENYSGTTDKDRRYSKLLQEPAHQNLVLINRLMNDLAQDIRRGTTYVANERQNLTVLALAIKNGELFGTSLATGQ